MPAAVLTEEDFDDPGDFGAYLEARRIMRSSDLVLTTHWTFEQLERQPRNRVEELITYLNIKGAIENEQQELRRSRGTG